MKKKFVFKDFTEILAENKSSSIKYKTNKILSNLDKKLKSFYSFNLGNLKKFGKKNKK